MKNIIFLLTLFVATATLQAESDWRWSLTLGTGVIDYEEDVAYTQDGVLSGDTFTYDDTYNPGIYGIGLTNGTHSLSYKITSAGSSEYNLKRTGGEPYSVPVTKTQLERDYKETTISYQYKLSGSWSLGIAYNDKEHEYNTSGFQTYPYNISETLLEAGETADYIRTRNINTSSSQDGLALYATWVKQMSDVWYFSAKLGLSETSLDSQWTEMYTFSGLPAYANNYYTTNFGTVNGAGYGYKGSDDGDSTTAIVGFSLVRIFPSAPNHQILVNYDTRSDDLAGDTVWQNIPGTGYFAGDDIDITVEGGQGSQIEETNWKLTAEWKYTF